jgi:phospholipid-binding lipoprotein MlaA
MARVGGRLLAWALALGLGASLGACAAPGARGEWRQHPTFYASGTHLEYSLKYRGRNAMLPVPARIAEQARDEAWWGEPTGTPATAFEDLPELDEYDPWEPYNEPMFRFNRRVDRYVLKPAAQAWDTILPDAAERALSRAFTNLAMPRRLVNNLLQLRGGAALRELGRFVINSTVGIAGFFDVAAKLGIEGSDADAGQTLGLYGVGPGPYLIVPVLPPLTVRDGLGFAADLLLDPLGYLLPFAATAGMTAGRVVNERSLNLETFEDIERDLFDPYGAVRNAYLERRRQLILEGLQDSFRE